MGNGELTVGGTIEAESLSGSLSKGCYHSEIHTIRVPMENAPVTLTDDTMVKVDPHAGTVEFQSQTWPFTSKDIPGHVARRALLIMDDWIACAAGDCHTYGRGRAKASA